MDIHINQESAGRLLIEVCIFYIIITFKRECLQAKLLHK